MLKKSFRWHSTETIAVLVQNILADDSMVNEHVDEKKLNTLVAELGRISQEFDFLSESDFNQSNKKEIFNKCMTLIKVLDDRLLAGLQDAAESVIESLDSLEEAKFTRVSKESCELMTATKLIINLKIIGANLTQFLQMALERHRDVLKCEIQGEVATRTDTIRALLPALYSNLQDKDTETASTVFILTKIKKAVWEVVTLFERSNLPSGKEKYVKTGLFLMDMDAVLDGHTTDWREFCAIVKRIITHSLAVSKSCGEKDSEEIVLVCTNIVKSLEDGSQESHILAVQDLLELLEEKVNSGLLRLAIGCMCCVGEPLDSLLLATLTSEVSTERRLTEDLSAHVERFDVHTDDVMSLCEFCVTSTKNLHEAQKLRSAAKILETLEPEMVPAIFQVYLYPDNVHHKKNLKRLRQIWRKTEDQVRESVRKIVDPTAFCVLIDEEACNLAKKFSNNMYEQDKCKLRRMMHQLVGMCEVGIDLAWQESRGRQPLPDSHPLVRTERAVWEVRAAARLVLDALHDLKLHQAFVKRVKVLVTVFHEMSMWLVEMAENLTANETESNNILLGCSASNNVEGAISHESLIDKSLIVPTFRRSETGENRISFRSIRHLDRTSALAERLRRNVYKLTVDLGPYTPEVSATPRNSRRKKTLNPDRTPKSSMVRSLMENSPPPNIVRTPESTVRLFNVLDELSALSHELSVNLGMSAVTAKAALEAGNADTSLRRTAMKNNRKT